MPGHRRHPDPDVFTDIGDRSSNQCPGRIGPGGTYSGKGTWYTPDNPTGNCLYDNALQDPSGAFAAMNETDYETARMCGAYIEATGPKGTIRVKIVDRCPLPCAPGQIDFSKQAFTRIAGDPQLGEVPISWHLVSPADIGNVEYVVRNGSSEWYLAIQPRNHRNPVASLEISVNGKWQVLERQMWNYFLPTPAGLGKGPFTVRLTDIYGEQLISSGITLTPGTVQSTSAQFAQH
ncbi:expansin EXLX1 family cellulose-binding protein [Frankia sp. Cppng1_Ct_nod]|uniref:expansin EXLX1 family cellulose-binding protein n=1 Tax=Frankia sp. Cppng1_Ct_nod TaxID=2897162 RepID=UPI0010412A13|nr:expansin EXLX1 family cellulose-binding protein [Frankia sp. Cppng1_Ct_nod]